MAGGNSHLNALPPIPFHASFPLLLICHVYPVGIHKCKFRRGWSFYRVLWAIAFGTYRGIWRRHNIHRGQHEYSTTYQLPPDLGMPPHKYCTCRSGFPLSGYLNSRSDDWWGLSPDECACRIFPIPANRFYVVVRIRQNIDDFVLHGRLFYWSSILARVSPQ